LSLQVIVVVLLVLFTGAFARSALGFGDGLIAMPLLSLLIGIKYATPIVALIALTISLALVIFNWRQVDFLAAWRLVLSSMIGIPVGLYILKHVPENIVISVMGVILLLYGLYSLFAVRLPTLYKDRYAFPFGFIGGVIGGAYNTAGPPIVIYGTLRHWPRDSFRMTMQTYFVPTSFFVALGHYLNHMWTGEVVRLYCYSLPVIAVGMMLGAYVSRRIPQDAFSKIVYVFLMIVGVYMILQSI